MKFGVMILAMRKSQKTFSKRKLGDFLVWINLV